jgi:hypothetical protein
MRLNDTPALIPDTAFGTLVSGVVRRAEERLAAVRADDLDGGRDCRDSDVGEGPERGHGCTGAGGSGIQ